MTFHYMCLFCAVLSALRAAEYTNTSELFKVCWRPCVCVCNVRICEKKKKKRGKLPWTYRKYL